jgi:PAS domain S-box-containing protein
MAVTARVPPADVGELLDVDSLLRGVRIHLGMDVIYVAEVTGGECVVRTVDADQAASDLMRVGDTFRYEDTYCRRVVEGLIPRVVPDVEAVADLATLDVTTTLRIGSLAGAPLLRPDGSVYGAIIAYSTDRRAELPAECADVLRLLARMLEARMPVVPSPLHVPVGEPPGPRAGWWRDLPLHRKGAAVVALPLVALLAVGGTAVYTSHRANEADELSTRLQRVSAARSNTERTVLYAESAARAYAATGDPVFLERYEQALEDYPEARGRLEQLPIDPEIRRLVAQVLPLAERQFAVYADVVAAAPAELGDSRRVRARLVDANRQMEEMRDGFAAIRARENEVEAIRERAVEQAQAQQRLFVLGVIVAGALATALGFSLFVRAVVRRLRRLEENASRLARRQPLVPGTGSADEVGRLGRRLEKTAALLALDEAQLRAARQFFERLVESGPVVIQRRRTGTLEVTYAGTNVERLLGYSAAELVSSPASWRERIHPDDLPGLEQGLARAADGGEALVVSEFRVHTADGGQRWLSSTTVVDPDAAGTQDLCYLVDVTDRRAAEDDLREARRAAELANESKTEFLSRMSHELRTPLNAVLGFTQLLTLDPARAPQHEQSLQQVMRAGGHLLQLIDEVLDIARIESGRINVSLEPVQLAQVAAESAELVAGLAAECGVVVEVRSGEDHLFVRGDVQRLKQVLMNLLTNAVKYNRQGGRVWLEWAARDGVVDISVTDTGLGMTAAQLSRLFTPFDRLGREGSQVEGSGIGLALAHRLVTLMKGSISVDSAPDSGSRFTVTLTRADTPAAGTQSHLPEPVAAVDGAARTVLYVEDNASNIELMQQILAARTDLRLEVATSGGEALERLSGERPALVVLDVNLPDMTGDQVLRAIRARPETADLPVLVLSADATEWSRQRLLDAGADTYVTKPIDVRKFLAVLYDAFAGVPR